MKPQRPSEELLADCRPPPPWPEIDVSLKTWAELAETREVIDAECRAGKRELADYVRKITGK